MVQRYTLKVSLWALTNMVIARASEMSPDPSLDSTRNAKLS
jgi:hypothetical protein